MWISGIAAKLQACKMNSDQERGVQHSVRSQGTLAGIVLTPEDYQCLTTDQEARSQLGADYQYTMGAVFVTPEEYQRLAVSRRSKRADTVNLVWCLLSLAFLITSLIFLLRVLHAVHSHDRTVAEASSGGRTMIGTSAVKYNANHAPVMSRPVQSQLHQDVVRVLRTSQYKAFAALLDNMTESVVRLGITVFAPNDGALSNFQNNKTEELRPEDVVKFHVITDVIPFSNLLRLEVGSRLTTEVFDITVLVTNVTAGAFGVDDAVIIDPDLYTDATIAVHGINAVFNTSKIVEEESDEPLSGGGNPEGGLPFPFHSRGFKTIVKVNGISVYQILMSCAGLFLIYLAVEV